MEDIKKQQHDKKLAQLKDITQVIGKALEEKIDQENPQEVAGKMEELTVLLSNSCHAVALAEMTYADKIGSLVESSAFSSLSATDKKMVFAGRAKNEVYYVTLTERQNRALTHKIEALRSMLSYIKSEQAITQRN